MKKTKSYIITFSETEYGALLSVLAYTAGLVKYMSGAPQHETLKDQADFMYKQLEPEDD